MDASSNLPGKNYKIRGLNSMKSFSEECAVLKEDLKEKTPPNLLIHNNENKSQNSDDVKSAQPRQKNRLFRGGKKLSRNMWASVGHDKTARKNRVLKSEKSMDDAMFLTEKSRIVDRETNFDTLPEDVCLESFSDTLRRGSICEEIEKVIIQGGLSLHEMRKAMVIEETLKERFLM